MAGEGEKRRRYGGYREPIPEGRSIEELEERAREQSEASKHLTSVNIDYEHNGDGYRVTNLYGRTSSGAQPKEDMGHFDTSEEAFRAARKIRREHTSTGVIIYGPEGEIEHPEDEPGEE